MMHPSQPLFPPHLDRMATRSLSLLFVLEEWLKIVQKIEWLRKQPIVDPKETLLQWEHALLLVSIPCPSKRAEIPPETLKEGGLLDRLCFYSDILLQASSTGGVALLALLESMRGSCLLVRSNFLRKTERRLEELLKTLGEEFHEKLVSFFTALYPFLKEARTNENVLVRLLEKRETINHFLGPRTVEELLKGFFPLGIEELKAVVYEGFSRRGFEDYFSAKEPLINTLDWEGACEVVAK